jgi:hypothetical protein
MLRQTIVSPLIAGATTARPLGGLSGVRPGTPSSIATATSTTWTVTPFAGNIDGATAAIAGVYAYAFDTNQTGSVTAAGASPRVDRLDVQVVDPAEGGVSGANPLIQIVYSVGTPGLVAAPAQSHPLAQINVPASGGGSPTVTWFAPYTAAAGGIQPVPASTYPASPYLGQYVDDATLGLLRYNGTGWVPAPSGLNRIVPTSVTGGTLGAGGVVTYTAVGGVKLNGVFSSLFDNYLIIIDNASKSAASNVAFQVSLAGTVDSTAANYSAVRGYDNASGRTVATVSASLGAVELEAGTQGRTDIKVDVFSPARATPTLIDARANSYPYRADVSGLHNQSTAYDGFQLSPNATGTMTGTVRVYGYNNN